MLKQWLFCEPVHAEKIIIITAYECSYLNKIRNPLFLMFSHRVTAFF